MCVPDIMALLTWNSALDFLFFFFFLISGLGALKFRVNVPTYHFEGNMFYFQSGD